MARIPLSVARPSLEREPGVSYPQGGGPIGAALTEFGSAVTEVAKVFDARKERQDIFDGNIQEEEYLSRVALREQEAVAGAPADGSDIVAGVYGEVDPVTGRVAKQGSFDKDFNEAAAKMPASQRQQFLAKREAFRLKGQQRLTPIQIGRRRDFEAFEVDKALVKFTNAIAQADPNDKAAFEEIKARGEAFIRSQSNIDELEIEKKVVEWHQNSEIALGTVMDPSQVRDLLGLPKPGTGGGGGGGGPLPADQMERAGRAMSFFTGRGYTKEQAAGIIGNLLQESSLRTDLVGDNGTAFGVGQWRGERVTRLQRFAAANGRNWQDFETQLAFVDSEMQTNEPDTYRRLKAATTVEEATAAFIGYERPRGWTADNPRGGHGWENRLANAAKVAGGGASRPRAAGKDMPIIGGRQAGRSLPAQLEGVDPQALDRFRALQNALGKSLPIVSGFRSAARNKAVGGAQGSQHISGNALDIDVSNMSKEERVEVIRQATAAGFGGIGVYENSLHVDIGPRRVWGPDYHAGSVPGWAKGAIDEHLASSGGGTVAAGGGERPSIDPRFASLTLEQRLKLANAADAAMAEQMAALRADLDVTTANAPVAVQNSGVYTGGPMPEQADFIKAYGVEKGPGQFRIFEAQMETAESIYAMQKMPADEIQSMLAVSEAAIGSGDTAELGAASHAAKVAAADATMKARADDPAGYVTKAFPQVQADWVAAGRAPPNSPQSAAAYQKAIASTVAAQRQLAIPESDIQPLPEFAAKRAVESFADEQIPFTQRIDAILPFVLTTPDPTQRQAIYEQLVKAGLPDATEAAFDAAARGDDPGAVRRNFEAATIDVSKLPGKISKTPAEISESVQSLLMDENLVGDIYFGIKHGSAENLIKMQRYEKTLANAIHLRMLRNGEDLPTATKGAGQDVFGKQQIVIGKGVVGARILVPEGTDPDSVLAGLEKELPKVRAAVEAGMARGKAKVAREPVGTGFQAVAEEATGLRTEDIMANGFFTNAEVEGGFAYIDAYKGEPVVDEKGVTIIFKPTVLNEAETEAWRGSRDTMQRVLEEGARQGIYP